MENAEKKLDLTTADIEPTGADFALLGLKIREKSSIQEAIEWIFVFGIFLGLFFAITMYWQVVASAVLSIASFLGKLFDPLPRIIGLE